MRSDRAGRPWRRLIRDRSALAGLVLIVFFIGLALFAQLFQDPLLSDATHRLEPPSFEHLLGTDHLGRDNLARTAHGARWSLGAAGFATLIVVVVGVALGALSGYVGGWLDGILMRVVDVLMAFPGLLLALVIVGVLGPGLEKALMALIVIGWVDYARVVRGLVLSLREREFVLAARALGASDFRIVIRHLLPNTMPTVIVLATLEIGQVILAFAGLGFLGLGAVPPAPEWGATINEARNYLFLAPQLTLYPGTAILLAVLGFNLLGDGLRDAFDPKGPSGSSGKKN